MDEQFLHDAENGIGVVGDWLTPQSNAVGALQSGISLGDFLLDEGFTKPKALTQGSKSCFRPVATAGLLGQ